MKRYFCLLACAMIVSAAPGVARGALSLQIGPLDNPALTDTTLLPGQGVQFFDLIFHETGPVQREGLFTYDIALDMTGASNTASFVNGPGTTPVQIAPNPAIAMTPNPASITVLENTPSRLVFNITSGNDLTDIDDGETAARVFYNVNAAAPFGTYRITFDAPNTVFGSGDPELPLSIEVALSDAGVITYVPEPGSLAAAGLFGLLFLRRRR
jgi:hypothetical protein